MSLGKNIRTLRDARGWTLDDLAQRSGVDVGTISALENRDSRRSQFATQLAQALEVSTDQLAADEQPLSEVSEEIATYSVGPNAWPFRIARQRFEQLPERDKGRIDGYMLALAEERGI